MTSEELHAFLDEYAWETEVDRRDEPLTLARLAQLERQKGVKFPVFYKEFKHVRCRRFWINCCAVAIQKANSRYGKQRRRWRIENSISWE
jgi:hypothetical protein